MNILAIADTHLNRFKIQEDWIGKVDVVIHCGDLLNSGSLDGFKIAINILSEQLLELKCDLCLIGAGNHDNILESPVGRETAQAVLDDYNDRLGLKMTLVIDELVEVKGKRIFISPYYRPIGSGEFFAFHYTKDMMKKLFHEIVPDNVDVLVTHGPPQGILDEDIGYPSGEVEDHLGCRTMKDWLDSRKDIPFHVFGHIHAHGGKVCSQPGRISINVATLAMFFTV